MELGEKLQELRRQKGLTQEELAEKLYVSRTAVSKWESGRGYPGISSLKAIAEFFSVSVDELLSGNELLAAAENDSREKLAHAQDLAFGILDCCAAMFLFLPLYGQNYGGVFYEVPLFRLDGMPWYVIAGYVAFAAAEILCGVAALALQNCGAALWAKSKRAISLALGVCCCLFFIMTLQPYAATLALFLLLIKGALLLKKP